MDVQLLAGAACFENLGQPGAPTEDDWFRIGEDRSFEKRHLAWLRSVCDSCPVKAACLEYAVEHEPDWGVFAGTTPRQRAEMRDWGAA